MKVAVVFLYIFCVGLLFFAAMNAGQADTRFNMFDTRLREEHKLINLTYNKVMALEEQMGEQVWVVSSFSSGREQVQGVFSSSARARTAILRRHPAAQEDGRGWFVGGGVELRMYSRTRDVLR